MFDRRIVAVKRIRKLHYEMAKSEVDILLKSDDSPNIVRYFYMVNIAFISRVFKLVIFSLQSILCSEFLISSVSHVCRI